MSHILGIYSKKGKIKTRAIQEVLLDFSLGNKGALKTKVSGNLLFSTARDRYGNFNIAENEDKSLVILFGGEIYDHDQYAAELIKKGHRFRNQDSSAEFALHSYEESGTRFLRKINGTFAFSIYNKTTGELVLANDTFGIFPLFICGTPEFLIFSSGYQPIASYKHFDRQLDYDAIAEYFALGATLGDKTFFRNIKNLAPASVLRVMNSTKKLHKYDNLNIKIKTNKDLNYFGKVISEAIRAAVQSRAKKAKNITYDLSGGADTRLILSNLTQEQRKNAEFLTLNHHMVPEDKEKDVIIAKKLATKLNLNLKILKRQHYKFEKYFDTMRLKGLSQTKRISALHGGEFLGGDYFKYCMPNLSGIGRHIVDQKLKRLFQKSFLDKISNPNDSLQKELQGIKAENKEFLFAIRQFTRSFYTAIYGRHDGFLTPFIFATVTDSPFWDKNLLKSLLTVPKEYLLDYKLYNHLYMHHFPELIGIPTNSPFAMRKDSCMAYFGTGIDRKEIEDMSDYGLLGRYVKDSQTWGEKIYNENYLRSLSAVNNFPSASLKNFIFKRKNSIVFRQLASITAKNKDNIPILSNYLDSIKLKEKKQMDNKMILGSFVDFEAWYRRYGILIK